MNWILCCLCCAGLIIQRTEAGGGPSPTPISTSEPNYPGGKIGNTAIPGPFLVDFKPPFPTNSWWGSFTLKNQNATAAGPFPFQTATTNAGLRFGMSDSRGMDGKSLKVKSQTDFTVGIFGLPDAITNRKATYWDTQVVCMQYFNGAGGTMDTCLVPGSPYLTFKFVNSQIQINSNQGDITSFSTIEEGRKFRANLLTGGTYLIYVVDDTSVTITRNGSRGLISPSGTTATLRFAKLKDPSQTNKQKDILDAYSSTYPIGIDFKYSVIGETAIVTWTWDVVGDPSKLLMLSYHHHRLQLQNPFYENIEYMVLLGIMRGVIGNAWVFKYDLPTITFHAEEPVHNSCLQELNRTLQVEVDNLQVRIPAGFYFWGGSFARDSRLALIAEQIGREDLIPKVLRVLKDSIQPWYEASFSRPAAYETNWGGLIDRIGWNSTADTGSGFYTDHHFMLAYIIHGAAVIGKYDPDWLTDHADFINHVCRDIGNPSPNDQYHTVARHMDFFQGHSWASGVANDGGGRGQEASAEAINAYYSMTLWGHTTKNQNLIDWAKLLLTIEIQGSMLYYHLYPNAAPDATPYPEQELRDYVAVGNLHDEEVGAWLYWGSGRRYQLVGIQILPLTPIVKVFADIPWMKEVIEYCREELENPEYGDSLKSVIYAAYSNVDPRQAHNYSTTLADWGSGNSHSNTLYFIGANPSLNDICSTAWIQPEGEFIMQDNASGKYVTTSGSAGNLLASTTTESEAARFAIEFSPGGSYIQLISSGKWVSATPSGSRLTSNKESKKSYELFKWKPVSASDGTYRLQATINKIDVAIAPEDGGLYNNGGTNGAAAAVFKLISVVPLPTTPSPSTTTTPKPSIVPPLGFLQSVQNSRYVLSSPVLKTTSSTSVLATLFAFNRVESSPDESPVYNIQHTETEKHVRGNNAGTTALTATNDVPGSGERFQFVPYQGAYIIFHTASGSYVIAQGDDTLLSNMDDIRNATLWKIVV